MKRWCTFKTIGCNEDGLNVFMKYIKESGLNYEETSIKVWVEIKGSCDDDINETAHWLNRLLWWE